jgi:hypothetical protein
MSRPRLLVAALAALAFTAIAAPASAEVQHLHYKFGPIHVTPGQNTNLFANTDLRPAVPGYITKFTPNLVYEDGSIPSVEVVHLHHGVWVVDGEPRFAVGEEKTVVSVPDGYGFRYTPDQSWLINYMIHNLTQQPDTVYITYDIDFIPDTDPAAAAIKPVRTQWIDVAGYNAYPVFDAKRGMGKNGKLTLPDDAPNTPGLGPGGTWNVTQPTTLIGTAVHLHPGGLNGYLTVTRDGQTKRLFTSKAHYWDPGGAVSWDVAMEATPADWKIALKPGDVVQLHVVYDVSKASWYESMGIMPVMVQRNSTDGLDPFVDEIPMNGALTHGRLAENIAHGGGYAGLPNPLKLLNGPVTKGQLKIDGFVYGQGDLTSVGLTGRPAVIRPGKALRFYNQDAYNPENGGIFHTITSCKLPCNRATGGNYPLANGPVDFDSGQLGFGPNGLTAAANRATWATPTSLKSGTYAYFCRVHPFMRGSFRVAKAKKKKRAS